MKEYVDLECNEERLDLKGKQLEKVVIKSDTLEWLDLDNNNLKEISLECPNLGCLYLGNNNLKEITLDCPNLHTLGLMGNPHNTMKVFLTDCFRKQREEEYLKDFFEDVHSPSEEELLVFKVVTGYECPWAYALTRYLYK